MTFRNALIVILLSVSMPAYTASGFYLRAGAGYAAPKNTLFEDINCASTNPPALFGCQPGRDGRPIAARGDFDDILTLGLGLGYQLLPWLRAEVLLKHLPGTDFSGQANFLNVSGPQPVSAELDTTAIFALAGLDLPSLGPVKPFVGFGAGAASHDLGTLVYRFPALGADAVTRTVGGDHTDIAWIARAGLSVPVLPNMRVDLAVNYMDLGEVRSDAGPATIVRAGGTTVLEIAGTRADLELASVSLSLRYDF